MEKEIIEGAFKVLLQLFDTLESEDCDCCVPQGTVFVKLIVCHGSLEMSTVDSLLKTSEECVVAC